MKRAGPISITGYAALVIAAFLVTLIGYLVINI